MEDRNDFSRVVSDTVGKLKEFGGIAKLHALIKAEEAKKQEQYYRLGKKYYSLFKDSPEKDLKEIVEKLTACDAKIAKLKEELADPGNSYRDVERDETDDAEDIVAGASAEDADSETSDGYAAEAINEEDLMGEAEEGSCGDSEGEE